MAHHTVIPPVDLNTNGHGAFVVQAAEVTREHADRLAACPDGIDWCTGAPENHADQREHRHTGREYALTGRYLQDPDPGSSGVAAVQLAAWDDDAPRLTFQGTGLWPELNLTPSLRDCAVPRQEAVHRVRDGADLARRVLPRRPGPGGGPEYVSEPGGDPAGVPVAPRPARRRGRRVTARPPRNGRPRLVTTTGRGGPAPARTVGVVLIDLTPHVERGLLCTGRPEIVVPYCGFPPGTNLELHIGRTVDVWADDPTLHEIVKAAHGCTIVVKGHEHEGVRKVMRVIDRMRGFAPAPERHGCESGSCELLYGQPDERNDY
jgi:hypothetical protein